jgi:hypothetical protein
MKIFDYISYLSNTGYYFLAELDSSRLRPIDIYVLIHID